MKILTIHIDDELDANLTSGAAAADASKSAFVRNAIREKLARDLYGIVDVPTLATARKNIVQMPQPITDKAASTISGETLVERTRRERKEREEAKAA